MDFVFDDLILRNITRPARLSYKNYLPYINSKFARCEILLQFIDAVLFVFEIDKHHQNNP